MDLVDEYLFEPSVFGSDILNIVPQKILRIQWSHYMVGPNEKHCQKSVK